MRRRMSSDEEDYYDEEEYGESYHGEGVPSNVSICGPTAKEEDEEHDESEGEDEPYDSYDGDWEEEEEEEEEEEDLADPALSEPYEHYYNTEWDGGEEIASDDEYEESSGSEAGHPVYLRSLSVTVRDGRRLTVAWYRDQILSGVAGSWACMHKVGADEVPGILELMQQYEREQLAKEESERADANREETEGDLERMYELDWAE